MIPFSMRYLNNLKVSSEFPIDISVIANIVEYDNRVIIRYMNPIAISMNPSFPKIYFM